MSLVTLPEARVRLEGDLEVLEDAQQRYRSALTAAMGRDWREKISALRYTLEDGASLEGRIDEALEHLQRRAAGDGWAPRSPALHLATEVIRLRRALSKRLGLHVELSGSNLSEQLWSCVRFSRELYLRRAREQAADARWKVVSVDNTNGMFFAVSMAVCCYVLGRLLGSFFSEPLAIGLSMVGLPLLPFSVWRYTRWRNELRFYASERILEAWKGHVPRVENTWTVKLHVGDMIGIRVKRQSKGPHAFNLLVRQPNLPERILQTFPTLEAARGARFRVLEMMGLDGVEHEVPDRPADEKEWLLEITDPVGRG